MRSVCGIAVLILLSACAGAPVVPEDAIPCTEPRPLVCTMEFLPTCAVLSAGGLKEFASPCTACADTAASSYVIGACPE
jgi:hypothetical protein